LNATSTRLAALNKIRKLDAADPNHKISYALGTSGTGGWPSVSTITKVGTAVYAKLTIPAEVCAATAWQISKCFCLPAGTPPTTQRWLRCSRTGCRQWRGPIPGLAGRLDWPCIAGLAPCRSPT